MKILAFDQASKISGYSFFDNGELIDHGTFSFEKETDLGIRLIKIREKVLDLIIQYSPEKVIIEDIQLQENTINNVKTFKTLAEVFGVIHELLTEIKMPYEAILATSWKSGIGIKGARRNEQKANAKKWVLTQYNCSVPEDEADAICIGAYASGIRKQKKISQTEGFDWSE